MTIAFAALFLVVLFLARAAGALRAYAAFQICFIAFAAAGGVALMLVHAVVGPALLGWTLAAIWLSALGEEAARGIAIRFNVEALPPGLAFRVALLSGLLVALAERVLASLLPRAAELQIPLLAADLRAVLGHVCLSALALMMRRRWRVPLLAVILINSLLHTLLNLGVGLGGTVRVETAGYLLAALVCLGVTVVIGRWAQRAADE